MSEFDLGTSEHFSKLVHRALTNQIRLADQAQALADVIGENADAINAAGFGGLLGPLQVMLADELVLRVTKLYDTGRKYPTLGIPLVLDYLDQHAAVLPLLSRAAIEAALVGANQESTTLGGLADEELTRVSVRHFRSVLPQPNANSADPASAALGALRFRRDKEIAHNELVDPALRIRASWQQGTLLLTWAKDFASVVGEGYMGFHFAAQDGTYMLTHSAKEIGGILELLLTRAEVLPR